MHAIQSRVQILSRATEYELCQRLFAPIIDGSISTIAPVQKILRTTHNVGMSNLFMHITLVTCDRNKVL